MNRRNMYEGRCRKCGITVGAGHGYLFAGKPYHEACMPTTRQADSQAAAPEVRDPEAELANAATEADLTATAEQLVGMISEGWLATVPAMVRDEVVKASRRVEIAIGDMPAIKVERSHRKLEDVVRCVVAGTNPLCVGPAGSGKTTLAAQVAKVLKRKFYCENRVTSEFKLIGFMNAQGKYVRTQFRDAYEKGGVFLFDEVDASDPDAMVALNSAIENGFCPFPDKMVERHEDFVCIAAGNTYGRGADRQYVGRNQLDASTLDRFVVITMDYDEDLEMQLAGNPEWTQYVQRVRAATEAEKVRHIVSPRASINGAKLLASGMSRQEVEETVLWKGLEAQQRVRITSRMGAMA